MFFMNYLPLLWPKSSMFCMHSYATHCCIKVRLSFSGFSIWAMGRSVPFMHHGLLIFMQWWNLVNPLLLYITQPMINLEYQGKDLKTLQMNIAPSSMTKRGYKTHSLKIDISVWCGQCWSVLFLSEGRDTRRRYLLAVRVTFSTWKQSMGFRSSMYRNLGYILFITI